MPKEKMLFSTNGLSSVRSSKLRSFTIQDWNTFNGNHYRLIGLFSKTDEFEFGIFDTVEEAKEYLNNIHSIIEGGK